MEKEEKTYTAEEITIITPPCGGSCPPPPPPDPNEPPPDEPNEQPYKDPDEEGGDGQDDGGDGKDDGGDPDNKPDDDGGGEETGEDGESDIDEEIARVNEIIEDLKTAGVSNNPKDTVGEDEVSGDTDAPESTDPKGGESMDDEESKGDWGEESDGEGSEESDGEGSEESDGEGGEEPDGDKEKTQGDSSGEGLTPMQKKKKEILKQKKLEVEIRKKIISLQNTAKKTDILEPHELETINSYIKEYESLL